MKHLNNKGLNPWIDLTNVYVNQTYIHEIFIPNSTKYKSTWSAVLHLNTQKKSLWGCELVLDLWHIFLSQLMTLQGGSLKGL
jgi:hypothetical protein